MLTTRAVLALLGMAVLSSAQGSCRCRPSNGGICNSITLTSSVGGVSTCEAGTQACDGCFCSEEGFLDCALEPASVFVFNGTDTFCEIVPTVIAACPPTSGDLVNATSCCSATGVAASPTESCTLPPILEITAGLVPVNIITYIAYSSNLTGVFVNAGTSINAFSASSRYQTIYTTGFPPPLPTNFFLPLDETDTTANVILLPNESQDYFEEFNGEGTNFQTYAQGTPDYNRIRNFNGDIVFPYEVTVFQSSTTGSTQTTSWTIDHCMAGQVAV